MYITMQNRTSATLYVNQSIFTNNYLSVKVFKYILNIHNNINILTVQSVYLFI